MPVYLKRVSEYDVSKIQSAFDAGLDDLDVDLVGRSTSVIKVNIVQPRKPESGVVTHPAVAEAVVGSLRRRGIRQIAIAEGPALGVNVQQAFRESGYESMAKRVGVKLVNLYDAPRTSVNVGFGYENLPNIYRDEDLPNYYCGYIHVPRVFLESDLYVDIAKLKTHNRTKVSLSLKSQWGILSHKDRQAYHRIGLHEPICHLARAVKPHIVVIDGIIGLEGNGPVLGKPKQSNVLLMGANLLETDIVGAELMLHDPKEIIHFHHAVEMGIGTWKTDVRGDSVDELAQPFEPAPLGVKKSLNFYMWRNVRACHLDDESFKEAFNIAKRAPKYWPFFAKFAYYAMTKRLDVIKGRGAELPNTNGKGKILISGDCARGALENMEETPRNVIVVPGCPPDPEGIIKAIMRM